MKILMVCLGNICRSPLAHGILEHLVKEKNLNWSSVFWIRIQLNPDLAKNLVPDPEDPESESGS